MFWGFNKERRFIFIGMLFMSILFLSACDNTDDKASLKKDDTQNQSAPSEVNNNIGIKATQVKANKVIEKNHKIKDTDVVSTSGTIIFQKHEGGFYSFVADDGRKFTPMNLASEYKKDGLRVSLDAEIIRGMMTTTQFGESLRIREIQAIN